MVSRHKTFFRIKQTNMSKCYAQCLAHGECWMGQLALLLPPAPWRCINLAGLFNPEVSWKPPCSCKELEFGAFPSSYDLGKSNALAGLLHPAGLRFPPLHPESTRLKDSDVTLLLSTTKRSH